MKRLPLILGMILLVTACGRIETGNVGVRTAWNGKVVLEEVTPGFYTAITSSVESFSAKQITVDLFDMKPKAKDNLSLSDMDIEIYYTIDSAKSAEITIKYANRNAWDRNAGVWYPAYNLVRSFARESAYSAVAKYDSLEIHKHRDTLRDAVLDSLQKKLDETDPDVFQVRKVVVRNLQTDPSVENAIKLAVAKNKELEAKRIELDIAKKQSQINRALDASLTKKILRQRELDVMEKAITEGSKPLVIFGSGATPLINIK